MVDMVPDQTGLLAAIATGMAALGAGAYKFNRMLKADRHADDKAEVHDNLLDKQAETIDKLNKRIDELQDRLDKTTKELTERADKMANERNAVMVENARLKVEVESLQKLFERTDHELRNAKQDLRLLKTNMEQLKKDPGPLCPVRARDGSCGHIHTRKRRADDQPIQDAEFSEVKSLSHQTENSDE